MAKSCSRTTAEQNSTKYKTRERQPFTKLDAYVRFKEQRRIPWTPSFIVRKYSTQNSSISANGRDDGGSVHILRRNFTGRGILRPWCDKGLFFWGHKINYMACDFVLFPRGCIVFCTRLILCHSWWSRRAKVAEQTKCPHPTTDIQPNRVNKMWHEAPYANIGGHRLCTMASGHMQDRQNIPTTSPGRTATPPHTNSRNSGNNNISNGDNSDKRTKLQQNQGTKPIGTITSYYFTWTS